MILQSKILAQYRAVIRTTQFSRQGNRIQMIRLFLKSLHITFRRRTCRLGRFRAGSHFSKKFRLIKSFIINNIFSPNSQCQRRRFKSVICFHLSCHFTAAVKNHSKTHKSASIHIHHFHNVNFFCLYFLIFKCSDVVFNTILNYNIKYMT